MNKICLHLVSMVFMLVFVLGGWGSSQSATYPERDVTLLVPWAAGGSTDTAARVFASALSRKINKTVNVENVSGASGVLGVTQFLRFKPDGYRILFTSAGAFTSQKYLQKLTYDPLTDLMPTGCVFAEEVFLAIRTSDPYTNLKEMEAYWKKAGKEVKMCSAGIGSVGDVMNRILADQMKIQALHIPFKNLGETATAVMGGHADAAVVTSQTATAAVAEGRLRLLALIGDRRSPYFPNVPTSKEQGYPVDLLSWQATFVQKNVPDLIVQKIVELVKEVVEDPAVVKSVETSKIAIRYMTPAEMTADIQRQQQVYGEALRSIGLVK
jgi:tripartite-type tricarboxylate transporter receptor subunit TctC